MSSRQPKISGRVQYFFVTTALNQSFCQLEIKMCATDPSKGGMAGLSQYEVCHEKTDLKVFVVVIPKEGWARV